MSFELGFGGFFQDRTDGQGPVQRGRPRSPAHALVHSQSPLARASRLPGSVTMHCLLPSPLPGYPGKGLFNFTWIQHLISFRCDTLVPYAPKLESSGGSGGTSHSPCCPLSSCLSRSACSYLAQAAPWGRVRGWQDG